MGYPIVYRGDTVEVEAAPAPPGWATKDVSYAVEVGGGERTFRIDRRGNVSEIAGGVFYPKPLIEDVS